MGCPITKHYSDNHSKTKNGFEFTPSGDNDKKIVMEATATPYRTNEVIRDAKVLKKYDVKQLIGNGTFSNVFRVENISSKLPYAIKVIGLRSLKDRELFEAEKSVLMNVEHPNIVKFKEVITSKFHAFIVMELATGGDLFERIHTLGHIDEIETVRVSRMLVDAIHYLHQNNITHRDLKPENILYYCPGDNSRIILTDFGFASYRISDAKMLSTYCGTMNYLSPEIISGENYTNKVDIWSLGVIIYFMLGGYLPFTCNDVGKLQEKILTAPHLYQKWIWRTISDQAKDFINHTLQKSPLHRFDSLCAKNHKWLASVTNTDANLSRRSTTARSRVSKSYKSSSNSRLKYELMENKLQRRLKPLPYSDLKKCKLVENCVDRVSPQVNENCVDRVLPQVKNYINESFQTTIPRVEEEERQCKLSDQIKSDMVITFDPSNTPLSKSDILDYVSSSCDTQSNHATEDTNSIITNPSNNMNIEEKLYEIKPSQSKRHTSSFDYLNTRGGDRRSTLVHLPPIKQQQRNERRLSYQEDVALYKKINFHFKPTHPQSRRNKCNMELFSTQYKHPNENPKDNHGKRMNGWMSDDARMRNEYPPLFNTIDKQLNSKRYRSEEMTTPINLTAPKNKQDSSKNCYSL